MVNNLNKSLLILLFLFIVTVQVVGAETLNLNSDTTNLIRGHDFTITLVGAPNTHYYVWFKGTSGMTGGSDNQPPTIQSGNNVAQDPQNGPFTIGSYVFQNGNGRTISQDVAKSSAQTPNNVYYALVSTDSSGTATFVIHTSIGSTKVQRYTLRSETTNVSSEIELKVEKGWLTLRSRVKII